MKLNEKINKCIHPITGWVANYREKYTTLNKKDNEVRKYHRENYDLDGDKMAY